MENLWKRIGGCGGFISAGVYLARDFGGIREMTQEHWPIIAAVLATFLPPLGIAFMIGGTGYLITTLIALDKEWANREADTLDSFADDSDAFRDGVSDKKIPRRESRRLWVLLEKYRSWLSPNADGHLSWTSFTADKAVTYAETLRAYGYVRGRFKIWREIRRQRREKASQDE